MEKKGEINIEVKQEIKILSVIAKNHPFATLLTLITIVNGIINIPNSFFQLSNYFNNIIYPQNIYLKLNSQYSLNHNENCVCIKDIKENKTESLMFGLVQNNSNSPEITNIFITFPEQIEVKPIPYKDWTWIRNSSNKELTYVLDYANREPAVQGVLNNLPGFEVKFRKTEDLKFKYTISGKHIKSITRSFTIDTSNCQENALFNNNDHLQDATPATVTFGATISNLEKETR